jgi:lipoate-protein ligase A
MIDTWRLIDTGSSSAAYNMALDEAIATAVRRDYSPPTLRFYGWDVPSVTIGCFQKISDINIEYYTEKHFPIIRRPTGGRAILHNHELTYSFSVKTEAGLFSEGLLDSYKKISEVLCSALSIIGLSPGLKLHKETRQQQIASHRTRSPLCFQSTSYGEITINNKKVVGSAQKRWIDGLLQQGSIPFTIDTDEMVKVFRLEYAHDINETFTGLKIIFPELNPDDLKNAIRTSFEEIFDTSLMSSPPSREEVSFAQELEAQKYLSNQWTFRR